MLFVSNKTDKLTKKSVESLLKEKYLLASDELFSYLANNDMQRLKEKIEELNFQEINDINISEQKVLYSHKSELSNIAILQTPQERYLLYMRYLDDSVVLSDKTQERYINELKTLNIFIIADILILVVLFLIILKMIYPLKKISKSIKLFGEGRYDSRVDISTQDEIGELSKQFNAMASSIEELITARERLLRDIAHELKTPIAKSKLALELLEPSKYKEMLSRANTEMEYMTSELLHIEKLNANRYLLHIESFGVETLITEALSRLFLEDDADIEVNILNNINIKGDLFYLSIALKNLIDNALKYTKQKPITIAVKDKRISVKSRGEKLTKPIQYYYEAFTQEDSSRESKGYGVGLWLVKNILDKHSFDLEYSYEDGENIFTIVFQDSSNSSSKKLEDERDKS